MKRTWAAVIFFCLSAFSLMTGLEASVENRTLGGHTFILPSTDTFSHAFVLTNFGFSQGFRFLKAFSLEAPVRDRERLVIDLSMIGVVEKFDLGIAFSVWIGMNFVTRGTVIVGVDGKSALLRGGEGRVGFDIGPVIRLLRLNSTQVALRADLKWRSGRHVSPLLYVLRSLDLGRPADTRELFAKTGSLGFQASLSGAQSFGKSLGLQTNLAYFVFEEDYFQEKTTYKDLHAGMSPSFDLSPLLRFPLALMLEYQYSRYFKEEENIHTIGGGLYYSGRSDLQLGLFLSTVIFPKSDDFPEGSNDTYVQIRMNYFF